MAPRMLHFALEGVFWQCPAFGVASEWAPWGYSRIGMPTIIEPSMLAKRHNIDNRKTLDTWHTLLITYRQLSLTHPDTDLLAALEG